MLTKSVRVLPMIPRIPGRCSLTVASTWRSHQVGVLFCDFQTNLVGTRSSVGTFETNAVKSLHIAVTAVFADSRSTLLILSSFPLSAMVS